MLSRIQEHFYWPAKKDKIESYCKMCDNCQSRKPSTLTKAPLGQDPVSEPMEKVTIDVIGPLPVSHRSKRYILVITDCFTKWTEAVAMPDQEAATIASAFVNNFVTRFGILLLLLSDGSTNFNSKLFCIQDHKDWDLYLPQVMMAYRSSIHSSTGQFPNRMVYGREILLPMAAVIGLSKGENSGTVGDYVGNLQQKLQQVQQLARTRQCNNQVRNQDQRDRNGQRLCYICLSPRHLQRDCTQNQRNRRDQRPAQRPHQYPRGEAYNNNHQENRRPSTQ